MKYTDKQIEKFKIIPTGEIYEYKYFCFADVSYIVMNGKLFGYQYEDLSESKKWFTIFFDSNMEDKLQLPEGSHFGEDCIYCRSVEVAKELCIIISKLEFSEKLISV